jgi:hypothetical protein
MARAAVQGLSSRRTSPAKPLHTSPRGGGSASQRRRSSTRSCSRVVSEAHRPAAPHSPRASQLAACSSSASWRGSTAISGARRSRQTRTPLRRSVGCGGLSHHALLTLAHLQVEPGKADEDEEGVPQPPIGEARLPAVPYVPEP